jgi:hypothetical protein
MLEGDSETFCEVFTDGGPLMKIIPLVWVRNARDNLPKDLYRRAMADGWTSPHEPCPCRFAEPPASGAQSWELGQVPNPGG